MPPSHDSNLSQLIIKVAEIVRKLNILTRGGNILRPQTTSVSVDFNINADIIYVTTSGGAVTILLPPAADMQDREIYIKDATGNAATNNITIDANGSETIDSGTTYVANTNWQSVKIVSNGVAWFII
ncbi:MAG: hypothetical protein ACKO96_05115 [Flammeovirgaceae bacterium]